jgi:V8-like Glu-specific endopeptidase
MMVAELDAAKAFLNVLRSKRRFKLLVDAAEACIQNGLNDPQIVIWQAQGLIETGKAGPARISLSNLVANIPVGGEVFREIKGLLGRAWKQTFFDTRDKSSPEAQDAIRTSFVEYKAGFDAGSPWAGVNLLALSAFAKRNGIPMPADIDLRPLAITVLGLLEDERHDNWYHGSRAEAYLATGNLEKAEIEIGKYVRDVATTAFELGSTLRQFTELWQLGERDQRGHGIIEALRAALLSKEHGHVRMSPDQVRQSVVAEGPSPAQLQAILGSGGQAAYDWWCRGVAAAQSVGIISHVTEGRLGTGFLVRRRDIFAGDPHTKDDLIVMTNAHVICEPPRGGAIAFGVANITFEAVDKNRGFEFSKLLWQSPVGALDCALLELKDQPFGIKPLDISPTIPPRPTPDAKAPPRVFVIGYPGGRQLTFSFEDNRLLDHEAPPQGTPRTPGVCHVHYRAPTEGGSSGSPVFESSLWQVIALHHAGGKAMPKLNGEAGTWPANEGIWIQSILEKATAEGPRP